MAKIFHLVPLEYRNQIESEELYSPASLEDEGFIHCCRTDQIELIAGKYFSGLDEILLLRIQERLISAKVVHEAPVETPNASIEFPHIYGPLNTNAIDKTFVLKKKDGQFFVPDDLLD